MKLLDNSKGNYRFLAGIAPYSSGVVAMPGYEILHTILHEPRPYRQGFDLIEQSLSSQAIIRAGETSTEAMQEKAAQVMNTMQTRLTGLQVEWSEVTVVNIYTVHPLQPFLATTILKVMGQAVAHGVRWFYSRPPIIGLEFEMDMRGIRREIRID